MIEFDVETTGFQPYGGKEAFMYIFWDGSEKPAECLFPVDHKPQEEITEWEFDPESGESTEVIYPGPVGKANPERIQEWFDRAKDDPEGIRAWNTKFDRSFADQAGFDIPGDGKWHDGMVAAHIVRTNPMRSIALKAQASALFGEEAADLQKELHQWLTDERKRRVKEAKDSKAELIEPTYADVPLSIIEPYGREDVYLTRKVGDVQYPLIASNPKMQRVYDFEMKTLDALYAVEKRGLPADMTGYRRLEQEVVTNVERIEDEIREIVATADEEKFQKALGRELALDDFNPNSSQQVLAALYALDADMRFMSEEDGKIKTDRENLEAVDHEFATKMLEYRGEKKVLSTYVRPMIKRSYVTAMRTWKEPFIAPDGRIHTTYRQVGARTGRMSSADPNVQNQPRDDLRLRYNIVADEGFKLVTCDLSNIEMRLFAAYAGKGRLLTAVRNNEDIHALTAKFLGIQDRTRAGGWVEEARQRAKTFNFSIIYGGGLRTIRRQQRVDMNEARRMKNRYFDAYPEVKRLQDRISWALEDRGYIETLYGRRMYVDLKQSYIATNYLVQGTAAEILKEALISCHEEGLPVVALVHDEIICHCPAEEAEYVRDRVIYHLTQACRPGGKLWDDAKDDYVVPLEADGDIVDRWSQAKKPDFVPNWKKELEAA